MNRPPVPPTVEADLAIVVPLWNERESLAALVEQIDSVSRQASWRYDLVMVDDGSNDGSWEEITRLARSYPALRGLRLQANSGKAAALAAGFDATSAPLVATMDADLQDDPRELLPMHQAMHEHGLDLISGWKQHRQDPWHKRLASRVFNWLVNAFSRVTLHDHNCGLKLYRRAVVQQVPLYGELHRFVPMIAAAKGFEVGELAVAHHKRRYGKSKYGYRRFLRGLLDLGTVWFLTQYRHRPMHFFGAIALAMMVVGLLSVLLSAGLGWSHDRNGLPLLSVAAGLLALGTFGIASVAGLVGFLSELCVAQWRERSSPYWLADRTDALDGRSEKNNPPSYRSDASAKMPH
jgi:glycosyltransferase involved in cell wall biosynthesis